MNKFVICIVDKENLFFLQIGNQFGVKVSDARSFDTMEIAKEFLNNEKFFSILDLEPGQQVAVQIRELVLTEPKFATKFARVAPAPHREDKERFLRLVK